ncbi:MAG: SRPBCC domain-containing protein [Pseudohongiellaceae bacterium]
MDKRVDRASRLIHAPPSRIYEAFATPGAMEKWLPPEGMTGLMLAFDFREGGAYRMRLSYNDQDHVTGKTSDHSDEVEAGFIGLIPDQCIVQSVTFNSESAEFAGEMRITWVFDEVDQGANVTVLCEDVPEGIRAEDHEAGLTSTLRNLAAFTEDIK